MLNCQVLTEKLPQIKQIVYSLKMKQKSLKTFDWIYFGDKSHFEEDGMQNFLVFQPIQRYFKRIVNAGNENYVY